MSWLKKITGGDDSGGDKGDGPKRQHERVECDGETLSVLDDAGRSGPEYEVLDVSMGGFAVTGYDGNLRGNQYFEFKLMGDIKGEAVEATGFANVVRVKDGKLAAKFTPQPRLKNFLRDYFASK